MDDYNLYNKVKIVKCFPKNLQTGFYAAYLASIESKHDRPVGACLFVNNTRCCGHNKNKTHPIYANGKEFYTIHAEMDAILKFRARTDLTPVSIYVFRLNSTGIAMSKPCPNCMKYLIEFGIRRIYYTIPEYPFYKEIIL